MPNQSVRAERGLSDVFRALADPTRRAVIEQLANGPATMTELARPFKMALPSFSQHLDVLEASGLVRSKKDGRVRTFKLEAERLEVVDHWLDAQRAKWEKRLDQLDAYLEELKEKHEDNAKPEKEKKR